MSINFKTIDLDIATYVEFTHWIDGENIEGYTVCNPPKNCIFKHIILEKSKNGYCWALTYNHELTGITKNIFSVTHCGEVKYFKTQNECKASLKKRLIHYEYNLIFLLSFSLN